MARPKPTNTGSNAKGLPGPGSAAYEKSLRLAFDALDRGMPARAIQPLTTMSQRAPKDHRVWNYLMLARMELGMHAEAVQAGERAVAAKGDDAEIRCAYGRALRRNGRYDDAILEFERALYYKPGELKYMHFKYIVYTDIARIDKALEVLDEIDKELKDSGRDYSAYPSVLLDKAFIAPKHLDAQSVIDDLDPYALDPESEINFRVVALNHLGRLYEHIGDHDTAFARYKASKDLKKPKWSPDAFSKYIDKLIDCWEGIGYVPKSTLDVGGERLIFVTGMMRSGTSLLEQMLGQLEGVHPGGEMNGIIRSVQQFEPTENPWRGQPFPITRLTYTQQTINKMSRFAIKFFDEVSKTGRVIDKQPHNVFYAPLIARMFPGCKIINCRREARDNCLSNYFQAFARVHHQTHDLYWMGRFYRDYERVSDVWSSLDDVGIYDLRYEELVSDPQTQTKKLCEYLGIEWDEVMLEFHTSDRTVRTASRDQVRNPLNTKSVARHEKFTKHLRDLYQALEIEFPSGEDRDVQDASSQRPPPR